MSKSYSETICEVLINALYLFDDLTDEIIRRVKTITNPDDLKNLINYLIKHNDINKFSLFLEKIENKYKDKNKKEKHKPDEYDSPWKDALEQFFPHCIKFFFPKVYDEIDWERGYEFLDKELQKITRDAEIGKKHVDKLVKVWLKTGDEVHAFIHLDVQSQWEKNFNKRMFVYNYRLFDRYETFVASFAILGDSSSKWRPEEFKQERWNCKVRFQFPAVKLLDYKDRWDELEKSDNPFAIVVMAHLKTKETAKNDEKRLKEKLYIVKHLYKKGFSKKDIVNLLRFIDWIMNMSEGYDKLFWEKIQESKKEENMPHIMGIERRAYEKAYEKAYEDAYDDILAKLINRKFQTKIDQDLPLIKQLSSDEILNLIEKISFMNTLGDIQNWIKNKGYS